MDGEAWMAYATGGGDLSYDQSAGGGSSSSAGSTYTVRSGDCLSTIGAKLGVSWTAIASANGIRAPYTIYPGQVLNY